MSDPINWTQQRKRLADLTPWPRNPRQIKTPQAKRLLQSVQEFGQVETLAIGPDGEVYNGHQRLNVLMQQYGADYEVDVRVASRPLSEKEREKLTVYLHKGAAGEWDFDVLANEFEIAELVEWGFDAAELGIDLTGGTDNDAEPQIDRAEELRQQWGVEPGQLWRLPSRTAGQEHRLICGDCTDAAVVERVMGGEKAAQTLTSPPYNVAANSSLENKDKYSLSRRKYVETVNDARSGDDYLILLQSFYDIAISNSQYVFINIQSVSGNKTEIVDFVHKNKRQYADVLIWDKGNAQPAMAHNVVNSRHEFVYVFSDKGTRAIGTKDFRGTVDNLITIGSNQDKQNSDIHKATFPVQFAAFLIGNFTNETEVVYEPFCGSGTTIIAAENLARQCRAVEISPAYVAVALQRYVDAFGIEPELVTG